MTSVARDLVKSCAVEMRAFETMLDCSIEERMFSLKHMQKEFLVLSLLSYFETLYHC
jgi:hypothetical protein